MIAFNLGIIDLPITYLVKMIALFLVVCDLDSGGLNGLNCALDPKRTKIGCCLRLEFDARATPSHQNLFLVAFDLVSVAQWNMVVGILAWI